MSKLLVEELFTKIDQDPESARSYLSKISSSDRSSVVSELVGGKTALYKAYQNGHYDLMVYIIEECGADVDQMILLNSDVTREELNSDVTREELHSDVTGEELHSDVTREELHSDVELYSDVTREELYVNVTGEEFCGNMTRKELHSDVIRKDDWTTTVIEAAKAAVTHTRIWVAVVLRRSTDVGPPYCANYRR